MPADWTTVEFGELLVNGTRNGVYKSKEFHGSGAKIVNMGELFANPRLHDVPMKRVELTATELEKASLEPGDLLFARRSLVAEGAGKCSIVMKVVEPTTFESSIIRARPDREKANSLFLYYFFDSPRGRYLLGTILRQVAVSGITGTDLLRLRIPRPSLKEQQAIGCILGTLDDKIELNSQMNQSLESVVRAIFNAWFVDFAPVHAKADGRAPIPSKQVANLFPASFVKSELADIPNGWKVGTLGDVAENPRRGVQPNDIDPSTPYLGLEHMPRRCIALSEWGHADALESNKFEFKQGEILFGKLRPYFHKVGIAPVNGVCSTDILVVAPKEPEWFGFVLGHVSSTNFVDHTNASSTGTKMPRTSWQEMIRYKVALPPKPIAAGFSELISPLVARITTNIHESHTLAALRDSLLPKLISGELQVPEAERIVRRCA